MRNYSLLRHIGKAVLFGEFQESSPVVMFTAYFDASGTKLAPILTVVGFVSRAKKWDKFNDEWTAILAREQVQSFHMTDFVSSKKEFSGWKGQTERRKKFIADLAECIRRHTNKGFGSSTLISDYNEVNVDFMLQEYAGTPFVMSTRACLGGLTRWCQKKNVLTENTLVIIEKGDDDQGDLIERARLDGFKVIPMLKSDVVAFQAGDLAAWKFRTAINGMCYGPIAEMSDTHKIIRSLEPVRGLVQNNGVCEKESLLKLCKKAGIPRRRVPK